MANKQIYEKVYYFQLLLLSFYVLLYKYIHTIYMSYHRALDNSKVDIDHSMFLFLHSCIVKNSMTLPTDLKSLAPNFFNSCHMSILTATDLYFKAFIYLSPKVIISIQLWLSKRVSKRQQTLINLKLYLTIYAHNLYNYMGFVNELYHFLDPLPHILQ